MRERGFFIFNGGEVLLAKTVFQRKEKGGLSRGGRRSGGILSFRRKKRRRLYPRRGQKGRLLQRRGREPSAIPRKKAKKRIHSRGEKGKLPLQNGGLFFGRKGERGDPLPHQNGNEKKELFRQKKTFY